MCSGRVDPDFVLRAFSNGIDGVIIVGCRLNECNYITHGNYDALNVTLLCQRIMENVDLRPERLKIEFMSGGESSLFAKVMNEFGSKIRDLGPLGSSEGIDINEIKANLESTRKLIPYIKMAERDKLDAHLEKIEEHEKLFTTTEINKLFNEVPSYYIDPEKCQACMICLRRCPVDAIIGGKNKVHVIDQEKCIKCGTCYEACPPRFGAVQKFIGESAPPPIPEEQRTIERKSKKT